MLSISFASNGYYKQQDDWAESFRRSGIKDVFCAREKDIPSEFVSFGDRGFGFWQWKSHLIKKYIKETDLLIYTDVDYNIVNSYDLLAMAKASREPCLLFEYPFAQRIWTKRDCFYYMGCDEQKYWDANHLEPEFQFGRESMNVRIYLASGLLIAPTEEYCLTILMSAG